MTIQLHGLKTTGLVPIGGVVATIPALAGTYLCSATTAADDLGYVVCGGQVINDTTSPLNGRTIPNINSDVFLKGHTTSNTAGGSNTHTHVVPGHYHYYGGHWSNDDSRWGHAPYGNGSGNTLQDGVVYGARAVGNGQHNHGIRLEFGTNSNLNHGPPGQYNQVTNHTGFAHHWDPQIAHAGWHEHTVDWHRHYIQERTTHGPINIDGRNDMTSGSSSTQPKFITVLYVMRIK